MEENSEKNKNIFVCNNPGCENISKLRCPFCKKYGIKKESYFCGKDCFNKYWEIHKTIHELYEPIEDGFSYTGKMRPYKVTPKREVPKKISKPEYATNKEGIPFTEIIFNKNKKGIVPEHSQEQIEEMRTSCKLARLVLDTAHKAVDVGVTTDELDQIVHETAIENDCYPSPLWYKKFPKSVWTSVNEVICNGIPDRRPLKNGDIIGIDVAIFHHGYHGKVSETYLVGKVNNQGKKLVENAYNSLMKAIDICKPTVKISEIGNVIGKYVEDEGFSVVRNYTGHGICEIFYTTPTIYHYRNNNSLGIMKPGNIFTIEPMINEKTNKNVKWNDDWTVTTEDGKRSAQFGHTILITEVGCEILTERKTDSPPLEIFNKNNN